MLSLPVTGSLPSYLANSTLYRVGPGRYEATHSDGRPHIARHWFDGMSMLHAFHINASENAVSYRSRFLCEDIVRAVEAVPRREWNNFSFGSGDPCRSVFGKLFQLWTKMPVDPNTGYPPRPNIGVTLQNIPGTGVTIRSDMSANLKLDEESLQTDHFFRFERLDQELSGRMSAAHGHYDENTSEFFNYVYNFGPPGDTPYKIFKVCADGKAQVLATVNLPPSYIHSFSVTERYVILIVFPMQISPLQVLWERDILASSTFRHDVDTQFIVVDRDGGGIVSTFAHDAFFCFHTVNAYDEGDDDVVIELSHYDDNSIVHHLKLDHFRKNNTLASSRLVRYTLRGVRASSEAEAASRRRAERAVVNERDLELASIRGDRARSKHRFVYGVSSESSAFDSLAKVDVQTGERWTWAIADCVMGEPIFVPDPECVDEDGGCLLVVVLDAAAQSSRMVVLDAKSMEEIAGAHVGGIVPLGFHGLVTGVEGVPKF